MFKHFFIHGLTGHEAPYLFYKIRTYCRKTGGLALAVCTQLSVLLELEHNVVYRQMESRQLPEQQHTTASTSVIIKLLTLIPKARESI